MGPTVGGQTQRHVRPSFRPEPAAGVCPDADSAGERVLGLTDKVCWVKGRLLDASAELRDMGIPFVFCVTHSLCFFFFLLLFHPALRTHNLTVLLPHNSAFVYTNDSAYSNFPATVGEHSFLLCSAEFGSAMSVQSSPLWFSVKSL